METNKVNALEKSKDGILTEMEMINVLGGEEKGNDSNGKCSNNTDCSSNGNCSGNTGCHGNKKCFDLYDPHY